MRLALGNGSWSAGHTIAGRFEIESEVGAGGIGNVYLARDVESGEPVALKRVRELGEHFTRFAREAQSLARFQHPHVVRYIAHGIDESATPYLVMEWLQGEDLRARLSRGPLSLSECVILARHVADALAAVHARGLLHRDIKPANLFLEQKNVDRVKLLDFGLVRCNVEAWSVTQTGAMLGTPGYMAPEQARGERDVDHRADLFALGCVLYKCLTGRAPFEGNNLMALMNNMLAAEPLSLREAVPRIPPPLSDLVHQLLAKKPDDRPQRADEVAEVLSTIPIAEPDEDRPPPSRLPALTGRERRLSVVLLVCSAPAPALEPSTMEEGPFIGLTAGRGVDVEGQTLGLFLIEQGGQMDRLADGTRVITPTSPGSATEQAAWAARCALALQAIIPSPMALAMGYREQAGVAPSGDAIERASAMLGEGLLAAEHAAGDGPPSMAWVAIDEVTSSLLDTRFEVRRAGRGHKLVAMRDAALGTRLLMGKTPPILGRDWELSTISALFRHCVEGPTASAVLVPAAAGMGKSRLARELVNRFQAELPEAEIWINRGDSARSSSPLHLLGRILQSALMLHKEPTDEARRHRILDRAAARFSFEEAEEAAAFIGELTGVHFPDQALPGLRAARADPTIMAERIRWAWEELILAECSAHPVVLILDDLQWADLPTVRLLDAALRRAESLPFMLLLLGRPEVRALFPTLSKAPQFQQIRLKPLAPKASMALVEHALGAAATPELCARLAVRAEGNAFYLEELIRAWAGEAAHPSGAGDALPETILATVQARLGRFDEDARRLLRAASVFGDVFWANGVAELLGEPGSPAVGPKLDALVAAEILLRHPKSRFKGEPELAFRHALLREGASAMLTQPDRALGHRLAAAWLARAGEQDPVVLARHFEAGGEPARAAPYNVRAAQKAVWGMDLDAAASFVERAVSGAVGDQRRAEALVVACEVHVWRLDWAAAARDCAELARIARPGSAEWAQAITAKLTVAFVSSRQAELLESIFALMQVEPAPEASARYAVGLAVAVYLLSLAGQFRGVAAVLARLESIALRLAPNDLIVGGWTSLARTFVHGWQHGDPFTALQHADLACTSFAKAGDQRGASFAVLYRAACLHRLGAFEAAAHDLSSVARQSESSMLGALHALHAGMLAIDRRSFAEADAIAVSRIATSGGSGPVSPARSAEGHYLRSEIARAYGDFAAAESELAPVLEQLRQPALRWQAASAALARSQLALGRNAEALATVQPALDEIESQGGEGPRGLLVRVTHAEALAAVGQKEAAGAALAAAHERLLRVAGRIADAETRARFLERVEENARIVHLVRQGMAQ